MGISTVGEIARRAGVPVHRVTYVIESRGIAPLGRAGQARVFGAAAVDRILTELARIGVARQQSTAVEC